MLLARFAIAVRCHDCTGIFVHFYNRINTHFFPTFRTIQFFHFQSKVFIHINPAIRPRITKPITTAIFTSTVALLLTVVVVSCRKIIASGLSRVFALVAAIRTNPFVTILPPRFPDVFRNAIQRFEVHYLLAIRASVLRFYHWCLLHTRVFFVKVCFGAFLPQTVHRRIASIPCIAIKPNARLTYISLVLCLKSFYALKLP